MTGFLLDTNVVSDLRKGPRADRAVREWMREADGDAMYLSVLTIGELQMGIARIGRRDEAGAEALQRWLDGLLDKYQDRILPIDVEVAREWAALGVPDPIPVIDGLLSATALVHDLTVVTRNVRHFRAPGLAVVNPFLT